MATITVSATLNIDELHVILARVEGKTIKHDPDSLESNPVLNAASALYNRLKAAAERVSLEGAVVLQATQDTPSLFRKCRCRPTRPVRRPLNAN